MNNDELQKAIDDITRDNAAPAPVDASVADNEALANEIAAAMPAEVAPVEPATEMPAAPAPVVPEAPAMPPTEAAPAPVEASAPQPVEGAPQPAPEIVMNPSVSSVGAPEVSVPSSDLEAVAREARKELYPLLDKVSMEPEEKFEICMEVAETDKSAISVALSAAKQFSDETKKAEALLQIIDATK